MAMKVILYIARMNEGILSFSGNNRVLTCDNDFLWFALLILCNLPISMISGYWSDSGCGIVSPSKKYRNIGTDGKRRDVSIVVAATPDRFDIILGNQTDSGGGVLQSWLQATSLESEIVIVVWMVSMLETDSSSIRSIKDRIDAHVRFIIGEWNFHLYPRRVRCVFATSTTQSKTVLPTWLLPHAYNLGLSLASGRYLLKLDADSILSPDFFNPNAKGVNPAPHVLYRGLWCSGVEHLNGVFFTVRILSHTHTHTHTLTMFRS